MPIQTHVYFIQATVCQALEKDSMANKMDSLREETHKQIRALLAAWFWNAAPWFQVSLNKILSLKATVWRLLQ